ncbi:hypothetical protein Dsin_002951 [Dipteronia sinensis]|uniref:Reverse transcriptase n=1 Tax=Dipteronia sinensis TaxID=43782 RepID=A0AAE0ELQ6_9ROSI|nr:hypothetical protein Dsin_002951 [Dipteronia sinensis]
MHPNKAGLDGLPALFYQKYWSIVGEKVTKACLGVLNDGNDLEEINGTLVALIPKASRAERITDFRSISLCNVLYKIIAKALANRFRMVLGDDISETQSAFLHGHLISDNAIVVFECMHAVKRKKKDTSVMEAVCSGSCSFLRKSFCWGRELLEAGIRWRIGSGESLSIYKDRWLPRPSTFKVYSPLILDLNAKVQELKRANGDWNVDLVREFFLPNDADLILSLPCSSSNLPDSITWHYEKLGSYSVKSGYHLRCSLASNSCSSGISTSESWWKFL